MHRWAFSGTRSRANVAAILLVLSLAACSPAPGASVSASASASSAPSGSPSAAPSASVSASASSSPSASASATGSPSASAAAACIDAATRDLLYQNINDLAALTADQQAQIIASIEAYDFSAVPNGAAWQQAVVAAFKAGDWKPTELGTLVAGGIDLATCP